MVKVCAPGPALEMLLDSGVQTRGTNRPLLQRVRSALHLHFIFTSPRLTSPRLNSQVRAHAVPKGGRGRGKLLAVGSLTKSLRGPGASAEGAEPQSLRAGYPLNL